MREEFVDAEGNLALRVRFEGPADRLTLRSRLVAETLGEAFAPAPLPSGLYLEREAPSQEVDALSRRLVQEVGDEGLAFAHRANSWLFQNLSQIVREEGQPHAPAETLDIRTGACRDYATLLMDLGRAGGLHARFVSGYQDGDIDLKHRYLHAWVEFWIEGLGWTGFDPTLGLATADSHIPLAAAAHSRDTAPVTGSFWSFHASSELRCHLDLRAS